jgi:tetratricopeptide (TPR) repeat protein
VNCSAQPESIADSLKAGEQAGAKSNWDRALTAYRQAIALAHTAGDEIAETSALTGMAQAEFGRSHNDAAEKLARESLAVAERTGDRAAIASALYQLGNVQYRGGRMTELKPTLERTLALRQELGDHKGIAIGLNNMGNFWRLTGDNLLAIDYLTRAERELAARK